jgi:hypothetical protein
MADLEQPSPEEVQKWLIQFLTPKTALIQEATVWLKQYLKMPFSIPVMFQILLAGNKVQVRSITLYEKCPPLAKGWATGSSLGFDGLAFAGSKLACPSA